MLRQRGWLAGWVAACLVVRHMPVLYQTAKPILKLFRPSGSPIILVSSNPCAETPSAGR